MFDPLTPWGALACLAGGFFVGVGWAFGQWLVSKLTR